MEPPPYTRGWEIVSLADPIVPREVGNTVDGRTSAVDQIVSADQHVEVVDDVLAMTLKERPSEGVGPAQRTQNTRRLGCDDFYARVCQPRSVGGVEIGQAHGARCDQRDVVLVAKRLGRPECAGFGASAALQGVADGDPQTRFPAARLPCVSLFTAFSTRSSR